jgi:hypothetical protein
MEQQEQDGLCLDVEAVLRELADMRTAYARMELTARQFAECYSVLNGKNAELLREVRSLREELGKELAVAKKLRSDLGRLSPAPRW